MRIGWTPPIPPSKSVLSKKLQSKATFETSMDESSAVRSAETGTAAETLTSFQESELQVKNYVLTVAFRQNWAEKSLRLGGNSKSREGFDYQDPFYWQPEKVAQRVISFTKAVAGQNDPSMIAPLLNSALKGLDEAEKILGNSDILQKTRESVYDAFQAWKTKTP